VSFGHNETGLSPLKNTFRDLESLKSTEGTRTARLGINAFVSEPNVGLKGLVEDQRGEWTMRLTMKAVTLDFESYMTAKCLCLDPRPVTPNRQGM
jgi:hypothetical protein